MRLALVGAAVLAAGAVLVLAVLRLVLYRQVEDIDFEWTRRLGGGDDTAEPVPFRIDPAGTDQRWLHARLDEYLARAGRLGGEDQSTLGNEDRRRGLPDRDLARLAHRWRHGYSWAERAERLNGLGPQFLASVNGLNVHYFDIRASCSPPECSPTPVLMLHGWPGSFTEFADVVRAVKASGAAIDLVVASLPSFGFSEAPPANAEFDFVDAAIIFAKLMRRVHPNKKYVCQGGDYGSFVCSAIGQIDQANVLGVHLNMATVAMPPLSAGSLASWAIVYLFPFAISPANRERLGPTVPEFLMRMLQETGYFHLQASKPETISHGLEDSPVFLLAWIAEKIYAWSDPRPANASIGFQTISDDVILDNIQVYLQSKSIRTTTRWYYYLVRGVNRGLASLLAPVPVPVAIIDAPYEIFRPPTFWLKAQRYPNLMRYTESPYGGHFYGMEMPQFLASDVISFIADLKQTT